LPGLCHLGAGFVPGRGARRGLGAGQVGAPDPDGGDRDDEGDAGLCDRQSPGPNVVASVMVPPGSPRASGPQASTPMWCAAAYGSRPASMPRRNR